VITAISDSGVHVKPIVDWERLEYVQFLDYRIEGASNSPVSEARQVTPAAPLKALPVQVVTPVISETSAEAAPVVGAEGSGSP
jgi:hypothetical protein